MVSFESTTIAGFPSRSADEATTDCTRLNLMGGFELRRNGEVVAVAQSNQRLLALLATRDRPITRSYVSGLLWPDKSERRADGSLRSTLWRLRSLAPELVLSRHSCLSLDPRVVVDSRVLVEQSRALIDHPPGEIGLALDIRLFGQDLLPDWYDDWIVLERENLRHIRLASLERYASDLVAAGDYLSAIHAGTVATQAEALRESAHRILIAAHITAGNYSEAIRQYNLYAETLERELGLCPSHLIAELMEPLLGRRQHGGDASGIY